MSQAPLPYLVRLPLLAGILLSSVCLVRAQADSGEGPDSGHGSAVVARAQLPQENPEKVYSDLETGIRLTHKGRFSQAIPYLRAARAGVRGQQEFAASFDLALCYVGAHELSEAIPILTALARERPGQANILNLLTQAYIGTGESKRALDALRQASAIAPNDEKVYLYASDACDYTRNYELGLEVTGLGLRAFPDSAPLHYQRGQFFSLLGQDGGAVHEFDLAEQYGAGSKFGVMAGAQNALLEGIDANAITIARGGLRKYPGNYSLLTILGIALLRAGAAPGEPQFSEALRAMEQAVALEPDQSDSQATLGRFYLMEGQMAQAIAHLEEARRINPDNTDACAQLAIAYRRTGNLAKARAELSALARINAQRIEKYQKGATSDQKSADGPPMAGGVPGLRH